MSRPPADGTGTRPRDPRRPPARRPARLRTAGRALRLLGVYVARFEAPVLRAALRGRASDTHECERLVARLSHRFFTEGLRGAGLALDTADGLPLPASDRPVLLLLRHSGPLNFQLGALLACHVLDRGMLGVGRALPGLDPAVGLLARRLRVDLIRWRAGGPARAMRLLMRHARDLAPCDALAYFPEGANMTAAGRRRALAELAAKDPGRARWADGLRYVLPPVSAGAARVLSLARDADVLVVGHTGLEDLVGALVDIGYPPVDSRRIHLTWWHTRAEDVPREPAAAAAWLDGQWEAMDRWIAGKRGTPDPDPRPDAPPPPDASRRPTDSPPPPPPPSPDASPPPGSTAGGPYTRHPIPVGEPGHD
ncbi:hypothetical protein ACIQM4_19745 [Streptomyces sp. NPDC091272]|uniref:hypothetical protein n=1 Tax=Streptomyces sp. NPDC091272 TaxID=3365981 RepID=UPI0038220C9B